MLFSLAFILIVACGFFFYRRWRKAAAACLVVFVIVLFGFGSGPFTHWMLEDLQADYVGATIPVDWAPSSTIVVLGMGTVDVPDMGSEVGPLSFGRIAVTAEAYRQCKLAGHDCKVLVAGGVKGKGGSEAAVYGAKLVQLGVKQDDLVLESKSASTWENAKFSKPLLAADPGRTVYLVTSGVHMRRALVYFGHFGIKATPIRSDYLTTWPTIVPMAFNFAVADLAFNEYRGMLRYKVYNALGLND